MWGGSKVASTAEMRADMMADDWAVYWAVPMVGQSVDKRGWWLVVEKVVSLEIEMAVMRVEQRASARAARTAG